MPKLTIDGIEIDVEARPVMSSKETASWMVKKLSGEIQKKLPPDMVAFLKSKLV